MTLPEAIAIFIERARQKKGDTGQPDRCDDPVLAAEFLMIYAAETGIQALTDLTPAMLRDFLARWYIEEIGPVIHSQSVSPSLSLQSGSKTRTPQPLALIDGLAAFFRWSDNAAGTELLNQLSPILTEMEQRLPRALEITSALTEWVASGRGAFNFPEFLASFEEGGRSQFDVDMPGAVGTVEGYFRVLHVSGREVEAEELISEERIWPIILPDEIAPLITPGYTLNLELVRSPDGWLIADCGFTYPPGAVVSCQ